MASTRIGHALNIFSESPLYRLRRVVSIPPLMLAERILFVDHDPLARKAFARAMRQKRFIVDIANDAEEALELAKHYPYAVIASDWRMPHTDCMRLIEQVRAKTPDVSCIRITGTCHEISPQAIIEIEIIAFIQKPWGNDDPADALSRATRIHQRRVRHSMMSMKPPNGQTTILLVEDNPADAALVERLLSRSDGNYAVTVRSSLSEA
ncbi:MAG: response regulator [Polyangiaceae bacterium]|nr:response regulator [Polyangiaceae bacterium]